MSLTQYALKNQLAVMVVVVAIAFLGLYSLKELPIQLFPDVENPRIEITTTWRAATSREMESQILEPLERVLRGIPGIESIHAMANGGYSQITLEFGIESDMRQTLLEVISRMNRLPPLPRDADRPTITSGGGSDTPALTWFFLQVMPGNERSAGDYERYYEDVVRPRIEAVPGVARVSLGQGAGAPEELQIRFDPYRAAEYGIDLTELSRKIGSVTEDTSGGFVDVGRRQYALRFAGSYTPEDLGQLVLDWREGRPVLLQDISEISVQRGDRWGLTVQNGNPAMSIRIDRESRANVLRTLELVKAEVDDLNSNVLKAEGLVMRQSFDASVFIYRAIQLVSSNLVLGAFLAIGMLWLFLHNLRATLLIALAIPVSLLASFMVLKFGDRSLNVLSLAGLAFGVGMVLDAAIVVLENIIRLRSRGEDPYRAAYQGTAQVWGALMASTATTVAIFTPVIFQRNVEGQLFADLALTIAIAVTVSLVVAVTVLPTVSLRLTNVARIEDRRAATWRRITSLVMWLTDTLMRRLSMVVVLMALPLAITWWLMPPLDYLPPVKRDAVDAYFRFPPGANVDLVDKEIIDPVIQRLDPYLKGELQPALRNYYIITWPGGGTLGIRAKDQGRVKELETLVREKILVGFPDTRAFAQQGNLFGRFGSSRSIDIHLQSARETELREAAREGLALVNAALPGATVQPKPGLELSQPELEITPDDRSLSDVGWSRTEMGPLIRAMGDGLYMGEYFDGNKRLDVIFRAQPWATPEELAAVPLATPSGHVVLLGDLLHVSRKAGPGQIIRVDQRRTITLEVNPPENMSLQEAVDIIKGQVEPELKKLMPADGAIKYGGSADNLKNAISSMSENFLLALGLLYLIMAALFRSARDSLLVILSVPLATVGGVVSLKLLNFVVFQPMDLLTMIGFIILLGLVVNNAILLVHETRRGEREGLVRARAVESALRQRLRPIFMSALTTIVGMLPLLLNPGAGSIIYRGLATVIVGGMAVSTLFTIFLLPALLRLTKADTAGEPVDGKDNSLAGDPAATAIPSGTLEPAGESADNPGN